MSSAVGSTDSKTLLALILALPPPSTISFFTVAKARMPVTSDMVESGSNCNNRKNRIAPKMKSRPTVFTVGIFFSATHMIAALVDANVTAPSAPPTQYKYDGVSDDILDAEKEKKRQ